MRARISRVSKGTRTSTEAMPSNSSSGMVAEMNHPRHGKINTLGTPIKIDGAMGLELTPPPRLGEHTNEILSRVLKYSNVKIAELHATGAIA